MDVRDINRRLFFHNSTFGFECFNGLSFNSFVLTRFSKENLKSFSIKENYICELLMGVQM